MPTTLWFSLLALLCATTMAGYHGFYLVSRFVIPEPRERRAYDARSVGFELLLTAAVLGPLLRRVLPENTWVGSASAAPAAAFYILIFGWLPFAKALALLVLPRGPRRDRAMATLYSVPLTVLYMAGVAYIMFITVLMMLTLQP